MTPQVILPRISFWSVVAFIGNVVLRSRFIYWYLAKRWPHVRVPARAKMISVLFVIILILRPFSL